MKEKSDAPDPNLVRTTTPDFVQYYNENIPEAFPRASLSALEEFQATYPGLFKDDSKWTIERHRKKLMDWLAFHGVGR